MQCTQRKGLFQDPFLVLGTASLKIPLPESPCMHTEVSLSFFCRSLCCVICSTAVMFFLFFCLCRHLLQDHKYPPRWKESETPTVVSISWGGKKASLPKKKSHSLTFFAAFHVLITCIIVFTSSHSFCNYAAKYVVMMVMNHASHRFVTSLTINCALCCLVHAIICWYHETAKRVTWPAKSCKYFPLFSPRPQILYQSHCSLYCNIICNENTLISITDYLCFEVMLVFFFYSIISIVGLFGECM